MHVLIIADNVVSIVQAEIQCPASKPSCEPHSWGYLKVLATKHNLIGC